MQPFATLQSGFCTPFSPPVDEFIHGRMLELFYQYLVVGGMPDAVAQFCESGNLAEVRRIQSDILSFYGRDISQYCLDADKLHVREVLDLIPSELNNPNKRFILKRLNENAVAQELACHGFPLYYLNSKKHGELDFVVEDRDGKVVPIEAKSGKSYARHRALSNILDVPNYSFAGAYVLGPCNVERKGRILYAPIYMVAALRNNG